MEPSGGIDHRRRGNTRRAANPVVDQRHNQAASSSMTSSSTSSMTSSSPPCGACKFLRRKCTSGCIFAPYFGTDQGAARFAAVHKVFGASNVSKLLTHIPVSRRHDAVVTISYEAQARLSDPVYGCVSTILALQQQVANLQAELSIVQSQVINSRLAVANALETTQHHQQNPIGILQHHHHHHQDYSNNNSSASTHHHLVADMSSCCFNYDTSAHAANVAVERVDNISAPPTNSGHHHLFEPRLRLSRPDEDEDEDGDSRARHLAFANQIVR